MQSNFYLSLFPRLRKGNFNLNDSPPPERPIEFDEKRLVVLLQQDSCQRSLELAEQMDCYQKTNPNHLYAIGKVQKVSA